MPAVLELEDYTPHAKQIAFHSDPAKYRLLRGAWRSGKTHAMVWEAIHMGIRVAKRAGPGATFLVCRKSGPSLKDTTHRDMLDLLPDEFIVDRHDAEGRADVTIIGGTRILFRSMDDWKKKGGTSYDAIFLDEGWEFTEQDFRTFRGRLSGRWGPRRMVIATNPPTRAHWLYRVFVNDREDSMSEHHFSMLDNAHNLPPDYVAEHVALKDTNPQHYYRFVLGEWGFVSDNPAVYGDVFREDRHVDTLRPMKGPGMFLLAGWDFGFNHPCTGWGQLLPTGHCRVYRELLGTRVDIRAFARQFKQESELFFPGFDLVHYCDPSGKNKNDLGTSSVKELRAEGIYPRYRKLRLWHTINKLKDLMGRDYLGRPLFQIDKSCRYLIEGFLGGYTVDPEDDEPLKDGYYDHGMDMVRYMFVPALVGMTELAPPRAPSSRPRVDV